MPQWRNDFVPKNKYTRPGILLKSVRKIVLHWTANPGASAKNHVKYFGITLPKQSKLNELAGKKGTYASAHIFADSKESICIIPLNEMAYHANDDYNGIHYRGVKEIAPNANQYTISYEMCVENDGSIHPDTIKLAISDIVELCKTFNLTEKDILRHYDVTHKPCPKPFVEDPKKFKDFKLRVASLLNTPKSVAKPPVYPGQILKLGTIDNSVRLIQEKLKIIVDSKFGPITEKAVRYFQKKNGLTVDGKVGPKTWAKLFN